jgi:hypothetical protein
MAKFLFAYHGGGGTASTEEQQTEVMQAWEAWFRQLGEAIVDPGNPTGRSATVAASVSDGAETNPLTGYTLVSADSFDDAVDMAKGSPIIADGGNVAVYETIDM